MRAWHFTNDKLRDGSPIPPVGEWLEHKGDIVPCRSGLHASADPWDALSFAPGNILHLVELKGDIVSHGNPIDKHVGRRRMILQSKDCESLLRRFACDQALSSLPDGAPDVVREYLQDPDESKRRAARDAARDAAWGAARYAAWAARNAARDAAWGAAMDAAREAAWDAARYAAWNAASAYDTTWNVVYDAAQDAAREEFNTRIKKEFQH